MDIFQLEPTQTPRDLIATRLRLLDSANADASRDFFAIRFSHRASYLPHAPLHQLTALVVLARTGIESSIWATILPGDAYIAPELWQEVLRSQRFITDARQLAHRASAPWLALHEPLLLEPVYIPKPWGQEIWYTGIEARGQAQVTDGHFSVPLPWVLELVAAGATELPILLKVLDPLAESPKGDLYFELHEEKREVYIVTDVHPEAWPDGAGRIQMGFCPLQRGRYPSDEAFKADYLAAVADYRRVRQRIDQADFSALPEREQETIRTLEADLRSRMNRFIAERSLVVGDVVKVPCLIPHSLQHGVKVVEFQTPVYERKILSFGQKVLTQEHWDTEEAMTLVDLREPQPEAPEVLWRSDNLQLERVVEFADFEVNRVSLSAATRCYIPSNDYRLLMIIAGAVRFVTKSDAMPRYFGAGSAFYLPVSADSVIMEAQENSLLLIAAPSSAQDHPAPLVLPCVEC